MNKKKLLILILFLSLSYNTVFAQNICSKKGYTIFTINGIFTDEKGAVENRDKLKERLLKPYNDQSVTVDYLYNPTHLAGVGDVLDVVRQGLFDPKVDYDLVDMLNDASLKVKTQKLLIVGHSQGNFYANAFYDKVVDKDGGVPAKSIGVYSVATPDDRVAGGGKYLTSDTDKVIAEVVGRLKNIMIPNTHIELQNGDDKNGHSFSDVYLKYKSPEIIKDIKSSLDKLESNTIQDMNNPCLSPQKISLMHKIESVFLAVSDPVSNLVKDTVDGFYNTTTNVLNGIKDTGLAIGKTINGLLASVIGSSSNEVNNISTLTETISTNTVLPNKVEAPISNDKEVVEITPKVKADTAPVIIPEKNKTNKIEEPFIANNIINTSTINSIIINGGSGNGNRNRGTLEPTPAPNPVLAPEPKEETKETDKVAPVISIIGGGTLDVTKDSVYTDGGATALDDVDGDLTSGIIKGGTFVDTSTPGEYTITYTVKDSAGNSTIATRSINVIAPDFIIDRDTTLSAGEYYYNNLLITNNSKLLLYGNPDSLDTFKGVKITAKNITIDSGSYIYSDGQGYKNGPGAPLPAENYSGATYGGKGERNTLVSLYGKATEPTDLGSSGGFFSWRGGGAIRLVVTNTLLNNGVVSANGDSTSSGGSIYVTAKNISGSGTFSANGGGLSASGFVINSGGGGRIALYYENLSFTGKAEALGGCSQYYNGYSLTCGDNGTVGFFDTLNNNLLVNSSWLFQKNDSPFNFSKITFESAKVTSEKETSITADELVADKGSHFTLVEDQNINIPLIFIKGSSNIISSGKENLMTDTIDLSGNSILSIVPEQTLSLKVKNLNIASGAYLSASGSGYIDGPGVSSYYYAGASYGGVGGDNVAESVYGNELEPTDFGSGGANNFRGGGAIRLIVTDTLLNNGVIDADGDTTSSGGSIYVTAKNISGNGYFWANGGGPFCPNNCFKPGGGGRIAIYYENYLFTGQVLADGCSSGVGNSTGGTVKLIDTDAPDI